MQPSLNYRLGYEGTMASTWTVLVVDDDATTRTLMRSALERLGLIVVDAANGEAGLAAFKKSQADLVILDANMPKMNGFEACAAIRRISYGRDIPIIMVTSMADSDSVKQAVAAGVTDYIAKPVNWAQLSECIREHLKTPGPVLPATT